MKWLWRSYVSFSSLLVAALVGGVLFVVIAQQVDPEWTRTRLQDLRAHVFALTVPNDVGDARQEPAAKPSAPETALRSSAPEISTTSTPDLESATTSKLGRLQERFSKLREAATRTAAGPVLTNAADVGLEESFAVAPAAFSRSRDAHDERSSLTPDVAAGTNEPSEPKPDGNGVIEVKELDTMALIAVLGDTSVPEQQAVLWLEQLSPVKRRQVFARLARWYPRRAASLLRRSGLERATPSSQETID